MKLSTWVVLVVLLTVAAWVYGWDARKHGELRAQYARLLEHSRQRDSVYRVEVSEMANQMLHYKNLRRTVRITDTVWVKQFIGSADSAIAACTQALETCDQRVAIRDSQIVVLRKMTKTGKWFGVLPKPRVQAGLCLTAKGELSPCLSGGFTLF